MARPTRHTYEYVPRVSSVTYPITEDIDCGTNDNITVVVFIMSGQATNHEHDGLTLDGVAMTPADDPAITDNHRAVNNNDNRVMSAWYMEDAPSGTNTLQFDPTDEPVQITFHVFVYHDAPGGVGTIESVIDDTGSDANPTISHTASEGDDAHVAIGMMSTTFSADPYSSTTGFSEILDSENAAPDPTNHSFLIGEDTTPSGSAETYESTQNQATDWIVWAIEVIGTTATAVDVSLSPATMTIGAQALDLSLSPLSVSLSPATLQVSAQELTPDLTALAVALEPATIDLVARAFTLADSPIEVELSPATIQIVAQALDLDITTPGIEITLEPATIQVVAQQLGIDVDAKTLALEPATLQLIARELTPTIADILFNAATFERRIHSRLGEHGLAYTEGKIVFICEDDEVHEVNFVYGNFSKITCSHGVGVKAGTGDNDYALFRRGRNYSISTTERTILEDAGYSLV